MGGGGDPSGLPPLDASLLVRRRQFSVAMCGLCGDVARSSLRVCTEEHRLCLTCALLFLRSEIGDAAARPGAVVTCPYCKAEGVRAQLQGGDLRGWFLPAAFERVFDWAATATEDARRPDPSLPPEPPLSAVERRVYMERLVEAVLVRGEAPEGHQAWDESLLALPGDEGSAVARVRVARCPAAACACLFLHEPRPARPPRRGSAGIERARTLGARPASVRRALSVALDVAMERTAVDSGACEAATAGSTAAVAVAPAEAQAAVITAEGEPASPRSGAASPATGGVSAAVAERHAQAREERAHALLAEFAVRLREGNGPRQAEILMELAMLSDAQLAEDEEGEEDDDDNDDTDSDEGEPDAAASTAGVAEAGAAASAVTGTEVNAAVASPQGVALAVEPHVADAVAAAAASAFAAAPAPLPWPTPCPQCHVELCDSCLEPWVCELQQQHPRRQDAAVVSAASGDATAGPDGAGRTPSFIVAVRHVGISCGAYAAAVRAARAAAANADVASVPPGPSASGIQAASNDAAAVTESASGTAVASTLSPRERFDADLRRLAGSGVKRCPQCGAMGTHALGHHCHHISPGTGCPSCNYHYCFSCLGPHPCRNGCPLFCRVDRGCVCDCEPCTTCSPTAPCADCDNPESCPSCQ